MILIFIGVIHFNTCQKNVNILKTQRNIMNPASRIYDFLFLLQKEANKKQKMLQTLQHLRQLLMMMLENFCLDTLAKDYPLAFCMQSSTNSQSIFTLLPTAKFNTFLV